MDELKLNIPKLLQVGEVEIHEGFFKIKIQRTEHTSLAYTKKYILSLKYASLKGGKWTVETLAVGRELEQEENSDAFMFQINSLSCELEDKLLDICREKKITYHTDEGIIIKEIDAVMIGYEAVL